MVFSAKEILKKYWGYDDFRQPQAEIIESVFAKKDTFALLPTGGGKSLCFQIPILMQEGICVVISPLVALMKDQVYQLKKRGIEAELLSAEVLARDQERILDNCRYGKVKLLYVSPERMQSEDFVERLNFLPIKYFAVDEAHCISEWGHDFRHSYLALKSLKENFKRIPILAVTATATPRTIEDITRQLGLKDFKIFRKSLERKNLAYRVHKTNDKIAELLFYLAQEQSSSIIFTKSRRDTYELAKILIDKGFDADYFHARLSVEDKNRKQKEFIESKKKILVSTNAFGMGIDKPDVRRVYHLHIPATIESYFQEVGRAGRDGKKAEGILFYGKDDRKNDFKFFKSSNPDKREFLEIICKLYNYYQIGNGELSLGQKGFSQKKFIEIYHLNKNKVRYVLQFLEKKEIVRIYTNQRHSLVRILLESTELPTYKAKSTLLLDYLARHYGGIFYDAIAIDEYRVGVNTGIDKSSVKELLKEMNQKGWIYYRDATTVKIEFLCHRDDRGASAFLWKEFREQQLLKWKRLNDIYFYIENENICKNILLLNYFGEKKGSKCGICSVCMPDLFSREIDVDRLYQYISQDVREEKDILKKFEYIEREEIFFGLQKLIDEEKIKFTPPNYYSL